MADSASDTSSIRNVEIETSGVEEKQGGLDVPEKTSGKLGDSKRYYALYAVHPQRKLTNTESDDVDLQENSQSLSVIATNLIAAAEIDLRKSISSWLSKDTVLPRKGRFASIGLNLESEYSSSAICYSSIVESPATDPLDFQNVSAESSSSVSAENKQHFVVSFISFHDSSLDLFRNEFDQYVQGLAPLLDKELFVACQTPSKSANNSALADKPLTFPDLSQLGTGIQTYLEQWPTAVLGYLTRTLQFMGADIEHLIFAALSNASLHISGTTNEMEEDIRRFFRCCSLSSLVEQLQPDNTSHKSITGSSDSAELWQLQAPVVSLTFKPQEQVAQESSSSDSRVIMNPLRSCTFCRNAADKLMSLDVSNVTKIRDFLESIKLAFVHNLNKLKRFLKQAEVDYYDLYRSLCYLKKCGCGELLMQYVKLDGEPETLSVLAALEIFIKDMNQNLT
ncbi:protein Njmu-R1 [Elysia marginata]|uniref:Protein Njmu-R1 n=1 Tax=Elysia marginata TaxID=1093978 RepID=A0AAV4G6N5_9GAST|nr:protein Njmu-R1 [Elysia marginata]